LTMATTPITASTKKIKPKMLTQTTLGLIALPH
jgi:hypothetical protein